MVDTWAYRNGVIENTTPQQESYYQYISQDYENLDDDLLIEAIISVENRLKIYAIFFYLVF